MLDHETETNDCASGGGAKADLLEELAARVRSNHRWQWEMANARGASSPSSHPERRAYMEMTERDVTRGVDRMLAAMEQQQVDSYYEAMEAQDYEDYLASRFVDDSDEVLSVEPC